MNNITEVESYCLEIQKRTEWLKELVDSLTRQLEEKEAENKRLTAEYNKLQQLLRPW